VPSGAWNRDDATLRVRRGQASQLTKLVEKLEIRRWGRASAGRYSYSACAGASCPLPLRWPLPQPDDEARTHRPDDTEEDGETEALGKVQHIEGFEQ
jgi:hypothetical protein